MFAVMLLGLIQGLTEFLPVSSSGHLTLLGTWLSTRDNDIVLEVLLHFGTLMATLVVFRATILSICMGIIKRDRVSLKITGLILAATIPTGIIGKLFEDTFQRIFGMPLVVSIMLICTGCIIFCTRFVQNKPGELSGIKWHQAVIIGFFQAMSIIPGISRSGTTISTALFLGVSRKAAGEYSFLISIPAIMGATILKLPGAFSGSHHFTMFQMLAGVSVSFVSGYFALKVLLHFVHRGQLHIFSWYCWALGAAGVIYFAF